MYNWYITKKKLKKISLCFLTFYSEGLTYRVLEEIFKYFIILSLNSISWVVDKEKNLRKTNKEKYEKYFTKSFDYSFQKLM